MSLLFTLLFYILHTECFDRSTFSNFRGTQSHDSFMSFKDKSFNFPLSTKWKQDNIPCAFNNPLYNFVVANGSFYCLSNDINSLNRNTNSSIISYNIKDGSFQWQSYVYNWSNKQTNTSWDGIVYNNQYVSILDDNYGQLYSLNASTGMIKQNVSIKDNCPDNLPISVYCVQSGMVSNINNNNVYIYYTSSYDNGFGTVLSMNTNTGQTNVTQVPAQKSDTAQDPTICNDGKVLITTNIFNSVNAYSINNNMTEMWTYMIPSQQGEAFSNPVICINTGNGQFQVLFNDEFGNGFEKWTLLDGNSGNVMHQILWNVTVTGLPTYNSNNNILVRADQHYIYAYKVENKGNWTEIWTLPNMNDAQDMLSVDDVVF
eukprot:424311_1